MSVEGSDIRFIGNFNNPGTLRTNLPVPPPGPRDDVMGTISGTLNNTGTLEVLNGTIRVTGPVTQISGTTLTAGTWNVADGAALDITSGSNIEVNNANVTLSGPSSSFQIINSLRTNGGSFALSERRSFTTQGALTNSGTIAIDAGSQFNVTGNYTQTSKAVLALTLAGLAPTQFGRLLVTGDAVLAGDLAPSLAEGFMPEVDNEFVIMTFNTPNGQFDSCSGCQLKSGLVLNRVFEPGRLKLVVAEQ